MPNWGRPVRASANPLLKFAPIKTVWKSNRFPKGRLRIILTIALVELRRLASDGLFSVLIGAELRVRVFNESLVRARLTEGLESLKILIIPKKKSSAKKKQIRSQNS